MERKLTTAQVRTLLGISKPTLLKLIKKKQIKAERCCSRTWRIPESAIQPLLQRRGNDGRMRRAA